MSQAYDPAFVVTQLTGDEGTRFFVYDDATGAPIRAGSHVIGNPTVGIGRNLASKGLSNPEIAFLCRDDIGDAAALLDTQIPWWRNLSPIRQGQMINLLFNLGWAGLSEFHNFLAAMEAGEWQVAVEELKNSHWWCQVGKRGPEVAGYIISG